MSTSGYHLAQVNIARMLEPLDSLRLKDFVDALDPVNAVADSAPGFIWRLKSDEGNATSLSVFEWDIQGSAGVLTNMSVWESFETLKEFVYSPDHLEVLRRKNDWFHKVQDATLAIWWIPVGHTPTIEEAESKVREIRKHGPTEQAFDLSRRFPPPVTV